MNEIIHFFKHIIGFCGEHSHPSLLISGGVFFTAMGLYWTKFINFFEDMF